MPAQIDVSLSNAQRQLYRFMPAVRRREFFFVLGMMLVGALAELVAIGAVLPFLSLLASQGRPPHLDWLVDLLGALGAHGRREQLIAATLLFMAASIVAGALRLQLAWSSQNFVFRLGHDAAIEIQQRILFQPFSFHIGHNTSQIVASLEKVQVLVFNVLLQIMQAATALFISLFIIATLIAVDPFTAVVAAIAFTAIYLLVSYLTHERLDRNSAIIGAAYDQRVQVIQESLGGIRDVIIDNSQPIYLEAFRKIDLRFTTAKANTAFIGAAPRFVIEAAGMVLIAAIALVISDRQGGFTGALPILGALALGAQRLLPLIQQIYYGWSALAGNRSVVGQVLGLLRLPVPAGVMSDERVEALPFTDRIAVKQVSFSYPSRATPALHGVDLTIRRGARVALVGRTGSGKSTLADLLMGLLEPTSGRIEVDGVPITKANQRRWQKSIAHVPQAIFLSDSTIARNIAFGVPKEDIDHDRVVAAATIAQLHNFVTSLPDGYETSVGERGVRISGGQRQRLGIARAVYKNAPVLVLDEATSALDDETERAVMQALDHLGQEGRTVIMIAHRLSTVAGCEIVARLEHGRIIEVGSFAEVIGKQPASPTA